MGDMEDMVATMEVTMAKDLLMLMPVSMVDTEVLEDTMDTENMVDTMEATMARDLQMLMLEDMVATIEVTMVRDLLMLRLMPASMVGIEVSEDIMDMEDIEDTIMDEKYISNLKLAAIK